MFRRNDQKHCCICGKELYKIPDMFEDKKKRTICFSCASNIKNRRKLKRLRYKFIVLKSIEESVDVVESERIRLNALSEIHLVPDDIELIRYEGDEYEFDK